MTGRDGFTYTALPHHVRFARGAVDGVAAEVERIGRHRAMVVATPGRTALAERIAVTLGPLCTGVAPLAAMHTPSETTDAAAEQARAASADCTVAVGGGSAIGLGKALAYHAGLPQIAVPTTYSGSEMTAILGQTEGGRKTTVVDARVLPAGVVYDPELTVGLPPATSVVSGMNAMAHAVEALYAREKNPVTRLQCLAAIEALARSLPAIVADPADLDARTEALFGAFLCGLALAAAGMALHHKLCHTLGGALGLPHAETHTVMLPHTAAFNAPAAPELDAAAAIFGSDGIGADLHDFAAQLGGPTSLAALGMDAADIDRIAEAAVKRPYWNPRPFDRDDVRALVARAHAGTRPAE